jgi:AraC-like DNA-binding protein
VYDYELRWLVENLGPDTAARHIPLFMLRTALEGDLPGRGRFLDYQVLVVGDHGCGVHVVNSTPHSISEGDVCMIGTGGDQTFVESHDLLAYEIHFSPRIFDRATWRALEDLPGFASLAVDRCAAHRFHLDRAAHAEVTHDLVELWNQWRIGTPGSAVIVRALFLRLLVRLARFSADTPVADVPSGVPAQDHEEVVRAAVRSIHRARYSTPRVAELAAAAHMSRRHFAGIFSAVTGQTPSGYIRGVRLERAKLLLRETRWPLSEVARATGFVDQSHFTRAFRADTGTTPSAYRKLVSSSA